jgi:hypothetical protein
MQPVAGGRRSELRGRRPPPNQAGMSTVANRLQELLGKDPVSIGEVGALLDGGSHTDRMEALYALQGPRLQRKLYALGEQHPRVTIEQLVPPDSPPLREVIFHGKNSLPVFTHFQKRFCRPPKAARRDALWGYNHGQLGWLIGPGYFVCRDQPEGAAIDYREVPPQGAPGWPGVLPNDRGLSHLVYKNMVDYLRRVSQQVYIGTATKGGKEIGSYFLLCREP